MPAGTGSIGKALRLLDLVAGSESGLSCAELERAAEMPRPTVARILGALVEHGLLTRNSRSEVRVGPLASVLADAARRQATLPSLVAPTMHEIHAVADETTYLAERRGPGLVYVDALESSSALRVSAALGGSVILHASAIGQAFLAALPEPEAEARIDAMPLDRFTATTRTTARDVREGLGAARERGVAITLGELDEGVTCFGVAICAAPSVPIAGLGVSIPNARCDAARETQVTRMLIEGRTKIEAFLQGGTPN